MRPRSSDTNLYRLHCPKRARKPYLSGKFITELWMFTAPDGCLLGQLAFQKNVRGWLCSGWFDNGFGGERKVVGATGNNSTRATLIQSLSDALRGTVEVDHDLLGAMDQVAAREYLQGRWHGTNCWVAWPVKG